MPPATVSATCVTRRLLLYQGSACALVVTSSTNSTTRRTPHGSSALRGAPTDLHRLVDEADQLEPVLVVPCRILRHVPDARERPVLGVLTSAQHVGERRHREREPEVLRGLRERARGPADHRESCLGR